MRIFFIVILLLFSCNKKTVKIEVAQVEDVIQVRDEQKPLFKLGSVFEEKRSIPVERVPVIMPYSKQDRPRIIKTSIRVDTVYERDTVVYTESYPCTLWNYTTKEVKQDLRWYFMVVLMVGFALGFVTALFLRFTTRNKSDKSELKKRDITESIKYLNKTEVKFISLIK